jgi:hypothetical protein
VTVRPEGAAGPELSLETDAAGHFLAPGLAPGRYRVAIRAPGYRPAESVERLRAREGLEVAYYLERMTTGHRYETVVTGRAAREEIARHSLETEEIVRLPGTFGDALRSVENLPGVARAPFSSGLLVINGAAPGDSLVALEGHYIPQLYHFGGLTSVINSDLIARIDYIPGNFGVRYGDAIGGVVDVAIRDPQTDRIHASVKATLPIDTTVLVEGPVGAGGFLLSARRSYIDAFLPLVLPKSLGLNLTAAPVYYDYQGILTYPLLGGRLRLFAYGSDDTLTLLMKSPAAADPRIRDELSTHLAFHRLAPSWRGRAAGWDLLLSSQLGYQKQDFAIGPTMFVHWDTWDWETRLEAERTVLPGWRLKLGLMPWAGRNSVHAVVPRPPSGEDDTRTLDSGDNLTRINTDWSWAVAAYGQLEIDVGKRVTLVPGVRFDYYNPLWAVDPRLVVRVKLGSRTVAKAGAGVFHEEPAPEEADKVFGQPALYAKTAYHFSLGLEHRFGRGLSVDGTGFFKYLTDLVVSSDRVVIQNGAPAPEVYSNEGIGRVYGLELIVRQELTRRLFGWVSYTLLRSERRDHPGDPWRPFAFDQTHILTVLASYKPPRLRGRLPLPLCHRQPGPALPRRHLRRRPRHLPAARPEAGDLPAPAELQPARPAPRAALHLPDVDHDRVPRRAERLQPPERRGHDVQLRLRAADVPARAADIAGDRAEGGVLRPGGGTRRPQSGSAPCGLNAKPSESPSPRASQRRRGRAAGDPRHGGEGQQEVDHPDPRARSRALHRERSRSAHPSACRATWSPAEGPRSSPHAGTASSPRSHATAASQSKTSPCQLGSAASGVIARPPAA